MTARPSRRPRAPALFCVAALGLAFCGPHNPLFSRAAAQSAERAPASAPAVEQPAGGSPAAIAGMPHTDARGRHLAPHGTFFIVSYVSAKTDKGVEGFVPGQEVKLVDVDREKHTLTVTDGRAEVEVSPNQLTNDIDIAAMVRQKDEAGQARINAYLQAEMAAYQQYEKQQAIASAQEIREINKEQAVAQAVSTAQTTATAPSTVPVETVDGAVATVGSGYYNEGGYGYGSPYSYFYGSTAGTRRGAARGSAARETNGNRGVTPSNIGAARSATAGAPVGNPNAGSTTGAATSATAGAPASNPNAGSTTGAAGGARTGGGGGRH